MHTLDIASSASRNASRGEQTHFHSSLFQSLHKMEWLLRAKADSGHVMLPEMCRLVTNERGILYILLLCLLLKQFESTYSFCMTSVHKKLLLVGHTIGSRPFPKPVKGNGRRNLSKYESRPTHNRLTSTSKCQHGNMTADVTVVLLLMTEAKGLISLHLDKPSSSTLCHTRTHNTIQILMWLFILAGEDIHFPCTQEVISIWTELKHWRGLPERQVSKEHPPLCDIFSGHFTHFSFLSF